MLELFFVDVYRDIGTEELFEAAGMVEVEVSEHHGFNVFDVVSCCFDCSRKLVCVVVDDSREEICHGN